VAAFIARHRGLPPLCVAPPTGPCVQSSTSSLPRGGPQVLGANLKCSESRRWAAYPSMCWTRIAHDDGVDGGASQTTRDYARPARSIFSNAPTRRLKGNPQTRDIPVIVLSAHALAGEREKAIAAGCDEFDTTPIEFDRLVATVRRVLAHRK
jgi:hypothetical protein